MEAKMVIDSGNREMFEVFCNLHPVEAYELHPVEFCKYFRSYLGDELCEKYTDDEIRDLIEKCKTDLDD